MIDTANADNIIIIARNALGDAINITIISRDPKDPDWFAPQPPRRFFGEDSTHAIRWAFDFCAGNPNSTIVSTL